MMKTKDYEDVELTTREDISEFQELQEPLYEKLEEIAADGCDGEGKVVKWSRWMRNLVRWLYTRR